MRCLQLANVASQKVFCKFILQSYCSLLADQVSGLVRGIVVLQKQWRSQKELQKIVGKFEGIIFPHRWEEFFFGLGGVKKLAKMWIKARIWSVIAHHHSQPVTHSGNPSISVPEIQFRLDKHCSSHCQPLLIVVGLIVYDTRVMMMRRSRSSAMMMMTNNIGR